MKRENILRYTAAAALLGLSIGGAAQTQPSKPAQKNQQAAKQQSTTTHAANPKQNEGQRIFEQNCSRCHTAPQGFSPNISGTIVRHMRVRASLSAHDEEELLRFFNP
jgi:cytochrome c5